MSSELSTVLLPPYGCTPPNPGELLVIVGEPGMGKTELALQIVREMRKPANHVEKLYLHGDEEGTIRQLRAELRSLQQRKRRGKQLFQAILLDGFPSVSEDIALQARRVIRSLEKEGAALVMTLRPEAEQILEVLPEARVMRTPNLLYRLPSTPNEAALQIWRYSNGIPRLALALDEDGGHPGPRYLESLKLQVSASGRAGIPSAECVLRLAMLLLGKGELDELSDVVVPIDEETLAWLSEEAPLFGIDLYGRTFCCAGVSDTSLMRTCFPALRRFGASLGEVAERVFELLVARGEFARAGVCCALIPSIERRVRLAIQHGVDLAICGSAHVVADAVKEARKLNLQEEPGFDSSLAILKALDAPTSHVPQLALMAQVSTRGNTCSQRLQQHLALSVAARMLDQGNYPNIAAYTAQGALSEQLIEHIAARRLLLDGHPSQALERLGSLSTQHNPLSVADVLISNDSLIASAFCMRLLPPNTFDMCEKSARLLEAAHLGRLALYERALPEFLSVIIGDHSSLALDRAIACAEQKGDSAIRCALLIAGALSDIRRSAFSEAHVRLGRAIEEAIGSDSTLLLSYARLFDAALSTMMGEEGALVRCVQSSQLEADVADFARLMLDAGCDISEAYEGHAVLDASLQAIRSGRFGALSPSQLGRDKLWLAWVLTHDFGRLSVAFARTLPRAWHYALEHYGEPLHSVSSGSSTKHDDSAPMQVQRAKVSAQRRRAGELLDWSPSTRDKRIHLSILGGFRVAVDGIPLAPEATNRRRARQLLGLLAAHESHQMRRAELIEDIWLEESYEQGMQRLYEAVSAARKVLHARELGFDPFVIGRGEGTIALNTQLVSIDIDELERRASACMASDGKDEEILSHASKVCDLYQGALDGVVATQLPWIVTRREQIRETFVDAMVIGTRSALRTGRIRLALQLAQAARSHEDLREDVIKCYMECLAIADRIPEACDVYLRYADHVMSVTGMPPTRELRHFAQRLAPGGRQSQGAFEVFDDPLDLTLLRIPSGQSVSKEAQSLAVAV